MDPSAALITEYPFLAVITGVEVNLFAIKAEGLFFVLDHALIAKVFWIKGVSLILMTFDI
jgi:hypothetical protein